MTRNQTISIDQADEQYDAIIIGAGMGGLSAAACLSLAGRRVLLLEQHNILGGCTQVFRRRGYEWDVGLHYVGDVHRPHGVLRRVFDHISQGELDWAAMPDVYNRIVLGERTYDYVAGVEAFKDRMKTYFPNDGRAIDQYVNLVFEASKASSRFFMTKALPPEMASMLEPQVRPAFESFADRTTLEVMRELSSNEELISVLTGHFGDVSTTRDRSSFAIHAMLIRHYINGASYPIGGASRIAETTCRTITQQGGAVATKASVESLLVRDGVVYGVQVGGREIRADSVVSAIGAFGTVRLLDPEVAVSTGLGEKVERLAPAMTCTGLNIGIAASNDELRMHPANLWVHPTADFEANFAAADRQPRSGIPMHMVTYPSVRDPSWEQRHPGKSTVSILSFTPWSLWAPFQDSTWRRRDAAYEALKTELTDQIFEEVQRFTPQVVGKVEHMELSTPLTLNHFLRREKGNFMGLAVTPARFRQDWLRAHAPVKGLYFAGQDVNGPGIGGAMLGGVMAASAATGRNLLDEVKKAAA